MPLNYVFYSYFLLSLGMTQEGLRVLQPSISLSGCLIIVSSILWKVGFKKKKTKFLDPLPLPCVKHKDIFLSLSLWEANTGDSRNKVHKRENIFKYH